ncbi:pre-rRNA-processing protein ESF2-like [Triticum dicoccoides]|uniref:pre-rRNA-processing protein ESF2-like n=1 Tax=Triticum dicoccoides TaxID=85692 RepID=UPI000E78CB1C|nr:pre-rRNA-processing protein ESF2-like [Triticum dicoccoides]
MAEATENEHHNDEEEDMVGEGEGGTGSEGEEVGVAGKKRKRRPLKKKSVDGLSKRGVCYLSRVPPHMNPSHVRQIFSKYGEVQRIYLVPEGQGHRKHSNVKAKAYSEGWVEFAKKSVAKRVANLLNGEQIGGKKRSSFYYDIWNIKYLRKFKWDDLVGEIAEKTHIREQKLTLEITAAKKQRDHYLSNAEKSRTQKFIRERIKKKQKPEGKESDDVGETNNDRPIPRQNRAVEERGPNKKAKLSKNILAGVFGGSS